VVSGTSGDADIRSLRVTQRGELGHAGRVAFVGGYTVRFDRTNFGVGHKTVARDARVVEAFDVTTPERTSSLVQEFFFGATVGRAVATDWRMTRAGEAAPTTTGRQAIALPESYAAHH